MHKSILYTLIVTMVLVLSGAAVSEAASTNSLVNKGNKFFHKGTYGAAVSVYKKALNQKPNDPIINFNLGAAHYKNEDYTDALNHFHQALLSEDEALQQKAYYNLGNTLYRLGEKTLAGEKLSEAVQLLEQSLQEYDKAIVLNKEDQDAVYNRDYVLKRYEELKEQLKEQQENQQDEKQQQDQKEEKEQNKTCPLSQKKPQESKENKEQPEQQKEEPSEQQKDGGPKGSDEQEQKRMGKEEDRRGEQEQQSSSDGQAGTDEGKDQQEMMPVKGDDQKDKEDVDKKEAMQLLDRYLHSQDQKLLIIRPDELYQMEPVEKDW